jgi:hypothetical protein
MMLNTCNSQPLTLDGNLCDDLVDFVGDQSIFLGLILSRLASTQLFKVFKMIEHACNTNAHDELVVLTHTHTSTQK